MSNSSAETAARPVQGVSEAPASKDAASRLRAQKYRSRQVAADIVAMGDILAVVLGGMVPSSIYALEGPGVIQAGIPALQWALIVSIIVFGGLRHLNMYDTTRMQNFPVAPGKLFLVLALSLLAVLGIGLPFANDGPHIWIWYACWLSASFTLALGNRIIANNVLAKMSASGAFNMRVAVYGTGEIARKLDTYLRAPDLGIRFAGVFDDRSARRKDPASTLEAGDGKGDVSDGGMEKLIDMGRRGEIDQIVIALPQYAGKRTAEITEQLDQLPVSVHICTHISSDLIEERGTQTLSKLGPVGLMDVKRQPLSDWQPVFKTAEDYILASILIVATAPIMALAALAIKLDSKGPVFFAQKRRGLNNSVFHVCKFRTMTVMEEGGDVVQAVRNDPRVTRVGKVLRRTSIDELPQLMNVLRGQMSLVGPRPHALSHDEHYGRLLQTYANRHQVKPGLTGWAQVNGYRGETKTADEMAQRVTFDLEYIKNWSIWFDLRILARTLQAVISNKNAY